MSTITVALVAYRRPKYLQQAINALEDCLEFPKFVDRVVCSVDDSDMQGRKCKQQLDEWSESAERCGIIVDVHGQPAQRGIVGNTILAMKKAFDLGAENVLMLEDDAVLKPDALKLASWFCDQRLEHVVAFSFAAHGDKGGPKLDEHPGSIAEYNLLTCPFAYVVRREHWPFMLKNWCCKQYHPCGWSWSITYAARMQGLIFMAPWLSRCENIGRDMGTNESPESWDKTQRGIAFSDGTYEGPYTVVRKIDSKEASFVDDWMLDELSQNPSRRFDGWLNFGCPTEVEEARKVLSA